MVSSPTDNEVGCGMMMGDSGLCKGRGGSRLRNLEHIWADRNALLTVGKKGSQELPKPPAPTKSERREVRKEKGAQNAKAVATGSRAVRLLRTLASFSRKDGAKSRDPGTE